MASAIDRWLARPRRPRAPIAWGDLADLPDADGARLASQYARRAADEHAAMVAFAELATELRAGAAAASVVAAVDRVVADELHHVDLCRRAAEALGGSRDSCATAPPEVRSDKRYPLRERTTLMIVGSLCVAETWSTFVFAGELALITHPVVRAIEREILRDEATHGRLGFAWVADHWRGLPYSTRLLVEHSLPGLFRTIEQRQPAQRRREFTTTLAARIVPRLERLGVRATRAQTRRTA
jgi:hypothetical protein